LRLYRPRPRRYVRLRLRGLHVKHCAPRRSYATAFYQAGARPHSVGDRLGHSTWAIARDLCVHRADEGELALVRSLDERINIA
jgi:hypothetical protein